MTFVAKRIRLLHKRLNWYHVRFKLARLRRIKTSGAQQLANALTEAIVNQVTPDEKEWIDKIEKLRSELNNSQQRISIVDYGAGKGFLSRSEDEMKRGIVEEKTVASMCLLASKPYEWALILFKIIRAFGPNSCIELGTCLGISAAYQAAALKLNQKGNIKTLEGSDALAQIASDNFKRLGLENVCVVQGRFDETLADVLAKNQPIDYAFIDGHHDEHATLSYCNEILPRCNRKALLIFDDISWSKGMRRAWKKITKKQEVKISLDLGVIGICLVDQQQSSNHHFRSPISL